MPSHFLTIFFRQPLKGRDIYTGLLGSFQLLTDDFALLFRRNEVDVPARDMVDIIDPAIIFDQPEYKLH